jgi:hypothetical protein
MHELQPMCSALHDEELFVLHASVQQLVYQMAVRKIEVIQDLH